MRFSNHGSVDLVAIGVAAAAGIAGLLLLFAVHYEHIQASKRWRLFMESHDCQPVTFAPASSIPTNGKTAIVFSTGPTKTGHLCNDGVTYWR
jgi:hypothetical protein